MSEGVEATATAAAAAAQGQGKNPRVTITYCTQCKWLLRAAYYAQELLSTLSTAIGEVALVPGTGGVFTVHVQYSSLPPSTVSSSSSTSPAKMAHEVQEVLLWDFKTERAFPETKVLKQRVRDYVDPERKLGHSDTPSNSSKKTHTVAVSEAT